MLLFQAACSDRFKNECLPTARHCHIRVHISRLIALELSISCSSDTIHDRRRCLTEGGTSWQSSSGSCLPAAPRIDLLPRPAHNPACFHLANEVSPCRPRST